MVQVSSGAVESNIKDFLHLLQGNVHKTNGNGMVQAAQLGSTTNPGSERNMATEGNLTLPMELPNHLYGEESCKDPNTNPIPSRDPYTISASDFQKIQVRFSLTQCVSKK